jgi:hypothetical protein
MEARLSAGFIPETTHQIPIKCAGMSHFVPWQQYAANKIHHAVSIVACTNHFAKTTLVFPLFR